jgi:hypothetical protein
MYPAPGTDKYPTVTLSDVPAPPLVSLCKTLNTPEHIFEKLCPRECASIRARYRHARADTSVRRKEQLQQEVRQIIQNMQGDGTSPTIKQVRILLSQRNNWAEVSTAVAKVTKRVQGDHVDVLVAAILSNPPTKIDMAALCR